MQIVQTQAGIRNGTIHSEMNDDQVREQVIDRGNLLILKGVFPAETLLDLRNRVFDWGLQIAYRGKGYEGRSFWRMDLNPPQSVTKHIFKSYMFNLSQVGLEPALRQRLVEVFSAMREFQCRVTGTEAEFCGAEKKLSLHPQVIHYPKGGGWFDAHEHLFLPQKIGLILSLSKCGQDYFSGGTRFFDTTASRWVSVYGEHDLGDLCLFRYDIRHDIEEIDPDLPISFESQAGKWSAVLPYN